MSDLVDTAAARQLADAASPGPWVSSGEHELIPAMATSAVMVRTVTDEPNWPRPAMARQTNDAAFIAWCRSGVPALCDALDAAVAERDRLTIELERLRDAYDWESDGRTKNLGERNEARAQRDALQERINAALAIRPIYLRDGIGTAVVYHKALLAALAEDGTPND